MCGIAGVFYFDRQHPVDEGIVQAGIGSLVHRGPDDSGTWCGDGVGLGFRRLSIIDLSSAGHQPMFTPDGSHGIVFNGEVYNYVELRPPLEARGHGFRSRTDTEVVLRSYMEYGDDCVRAFNGMWGFSLFDRKRRRLFCSRDRFGVKPFYYYQDPEKFVFASEIKALFAMGVPVEEEPRAVFRYVAFAQKDNDDLTFFKGVRQLLPGHNLVVTENGVRETPYWSLGDLDNNAEHRSLEVAAQQAHDLLQDAIRIRLRSDVPIGVLLSGGLDSSAITCCVDTLRKRKDSEPGPPVQAFAATYDDVSVDESEYIDAVIASRGFPCTKVRPNAASIERDINRIVYHQDEPNVTMTVFAHWYLMEAIRREGIIVILSGQGADECLAGYLSQCLGYHLHGLLASADLAGFWRESRALQQMHGLSLLRILLQLAKSFTPRSVADVARVVIEDRTTRLIPLEAWREHAQLRFDPPSHPSYSCLNRVLHTYMREASIPRILHYEDRNSMAFSIEERAPFLDYRLVEFFFSMPDRFKIAGGMSKVLLREAMRDEYPDVIRNRRSKIGFNTPESEWVRTLRPMVEDVFSSAQFATRWYVPTRRGRAGVESFLAGKSAFRPIYWRWFNLELWRNAFFGGRVTAPEPVATGSPS